jgi:DNA polymerase IV
MCATYQLGHLCTSVSFAEPNVDPRPPLALPGNLYEHAFVLPRSTILHADADAFYASVEQRDDPRLRGKPVIVGGGVVLAASYEARAHGVRGAMGGARARRLCPEAIVVPPRWPAYVEAGRALFAVFRDTAPVVEGISLEEAFLDVRGLERISGEPLDIARRLRREVRARVGLTVTVGVAPSKLLAKVASGVAKPDGLLVVPPGAERDFLDPLRVEQLWGVGPVTTRKLNGHGIRTVGQLARIPEATLVGVLGRASGRRAHALALGRDARRVRHGRRGRSVGAQSALGRGPHSPAALDATLVGLVDRVTRRMRRSGRAGRTVVVRLRFGDYSRASRSRTLAHPTAASRTIITAARMLLADARELVEARGITLIGVAVTNLDGAGQLALPLDGTDGDALDAVLDDVCERYGPAALTRGVLLGRPRLLAADWPGDG